MSSTICGPQYTGRGCECRAQVTPGVTPATGEASNPTWICAHVQDGIQTGCDPGCCPADCSKQTTTDKDGTGSATAAADTKSVWWIILIGILFGLMLFISYFYNATKRNSGGRLPIGVAVFTTALLVAIIVTAAVMLTKK